MIFVAGSGKKKISNEIQERDRRLIDALKDITLRGNNAEVKSNHDGTWIVYEVKKKKEVVG